MKINSKSIILIHLLFSISFCFDELRDSTDIDGNKFHSKEKAYKMYLQNNTINNILFGHYGFLYGVGFGGNAILRGNTPFEANTIWLFTPLFAGTLINITANDFLNNINIKQNKKIDKNLYFKSFYISPDISSIKHFKAEGDKWTAEVLKTNTSFDYPAIGYRTGRISEKYGYDFEMALLAHHTIKQKVYYNFNGEIYNEEANSYVELPSTMEIDLPSHFLMLHSLFTGLNFYYNLPEFGFRPYIGFGAGLLLNSVQSQYPGPANLVQNENNFTLDDMSFNWGYHLITGFRYLKSDSFYYLELRPTFHNYKYNSGSGKLTEVDQFLLQSVQFQIGIGKNLFK